MSEAASPQTVPQHLKELQRSREEIEEIVEIFRLILYDRGEPCGARAIRECLDEELVRPLPSVNTIGRILRRRCLTHGRTGYYPEDFMRW